MPDIKMGSVVSLMSEQPSENEVRIFWGWNFAFDVPFKFRIFKQVLNGVNGVATGFIHVGDTIGSDSTFIVTGLSKSTNYTITVGSVYLITGTTLEKDILFQTAINISTPPSPTGNVEKVAPSIAGVNVIQKTLRNQALMEVHWNQDDVSDHYNLRYFEKDISIPENAVQIDFEASNGFHIFGDKFVFNGIYRLSMQGCDRHSTFGIIQTTRSTCSKWSNQVDIRISPVNTLRLFLGEDSKRGLRDILTEFNKNSVLDLLRN